MSKTLGAGVKEAEQGLAQARQAKNELLWEMQKRKTEAHNLRGQAINLKLAEANATAAGGMPGGNQGFDPNQGNREIQIQGLEWRADEIEKSVESELNPKLSESETVCSGKETELQAKQEEWGNASNELLQLQGTYQKGEQALAGISRDLVNKRNQISEFMRKVYAEVHRASGELNAQKETDAKLRRTIKTIYISLEHESVERKAVLRETETVQQALAQLQGLLSQIADVDQ